MPKVKADDIQMYYEESGEGFPLIMIMGLSANLDWWDPRMIRGLSKDFRTIRFDNRGVGRSDASDGELTIKMLADDAAGLMDALGVSRAHVLGASMGGMIAQELALGQPEKVEKLVLCSTSCGGERSSPTSEETIGLMMRGGSAPTPEERARMVVPLIFTKEFADENPERVEEFLRRILRAPTSPEVSLRQLGAIVAFGAFDRLGGIKAPTLVVHGEKDVLIPSGNGPILARAIPGARLVLMERSAHGLAEDMEEAADAIGEFLRKG